MSIHRLDGRDTTLLLLQRGSALPEIAWWGTRLPDGLSLEAAAGLRDRATRRNGLDEDHVEAVLMPTLGTATLRAPGLVASRGGTDWTADFTEVSVLDAPGRLRVVADDPVAALRLEIVLELPPDGDLLTMHSLLHNTGTTPLQVERLAAGVFLVPSEADELLVFDGRWGREFSERRISLASGSWASENRRGRSHDRFPGLILGHPGFDEDRGLVYGMHLGWSGNHRTGAERLEDGRILVTTGEWLHPGELVLEPGKAAHTPIAYAAVAPDGLSGLSQRFHEGIRRTVLDWPGGTMRPRPVTLNTWEGNYFSHDHDRLVAQATAAARIGIERFVLDDGWMAGRNDERAGLGDWRPDAAKYPRGLGPLIDAVTRLGLEFGLWVEPEMVNPDSELYRAHPDAVLHVAGRPLHTSRHQLILDLTRPEIAQIIFGQLAALLRAHPIAALKWDMNRDFVAAGDRDGSPATRRHLLATYALLARLREAFPAVEIESCASGGGRPDLGILRHTHRVWTSDCTDALERLAIQRGYSRFLPPELMGAHVAASPNHQTGRRHTLGFRAAVALFGHMGVELDPTTLATDEQDELAAWIALHKRLRPLLHAGLHQARPVQAGRSVRGVVAADGRHAVFLVAQEHTDPHRAPPLALPGLDRRFTYRLQAPPPQHLDVRLSASQRRLFEDGLIVPGALLASVGIALPELQPETALILEASHLD
ncbi:alpha-galactosidase [Lichenicoccus sp.]|uniref:alpha-galactosidase n=1 Tax=Lichenicoccus sp. TaxID=2781899 RepID=UPI003D0D5926